ncbi:LysE family translocator [Myceligenerans halotolerans]
MSFGTWLTFAAALVVALAVPGPDFVLVMQSATHSTRRGLMTAAGLVAGLCLHAGIAIAGLAGLLASVPSVLTVLRLLGAAVLLWLGISMLATWRAVPQEQAEPDSRSRGFARGFVTNVTNPKALLFFAAVLPQFIGSGANAGPRVAVLAATVVLGAMLWWGSTILLIRLLGLSGSPTAQRVVTLLGGLALTGIALLLAAPALADSASWSAADS